MEYVSGGILLQYRFPANVEDPTELVILSDDVKYIIISTVLTARSRV